MNHLVGGGNPLWASVNYVGHCWELEWPFWTNFFAKCIFYMYREAAKKSWLIFLGFYPLKRAFFLDEVAGWPDFQKWGAPLNFGKLHHKEIAFVFGRGSWLTTFPKLRGAPHFRKPAEYEVLLWWLQSPHHPSILEIRPSFLEKWGRPTKMANFDDLKIEIDGPKKKAFPESILTGAFCKKRGLKWSNLACVAPFIFYRRL